MKDFTEQELCVLTLLAKGLNTRQIADELNMTIMQVKVCIKLIYSKMDVKNRVQAVVKAIIYNIVEV